MVRSKEVSSHMLINATTSFKALSKYTNEEYLTEWFSIPQILDYTGVVLINSS